MLEIFTISTFTEGDNFKVYYEEEQFVELTLVKVRKVENKMVNSVRQPFALVFKGTKEGMFSQGSFKMVHDKVGEFELFIVPVVPLAGDNESYYYEAIFS